jgi:hypothetical protein
MASAARFLPLFAGTLLVFPGLAHAVELVPGGYVAMQDELAAAETATMAGSAEASAVLFDFTPRGAGLYAPEGATSAPRVRFELSLDAAASDMTAEWTDTRSEASWLAPSTSPQGTLSIGGALQLDEWSLGGGFARTALFGGTADLVSATVGYGSISASLSMGEAERGAAAPLDVLMLRTDMAAWSWLKLESDVALGSDGQEESVAIGRLGVRLNF